jgi:hypothetical protein
VDACVGSLLGLIEDLIWFFWEMEGLNKVKGPEVDCTYTCLPFFRSLAISLDWDWGWGEL